MQDMPSRFEIDADVHPNYTRFWSGARNLWGGEMQRGGLRLTKVYTSKYFACG